MGNITNEKRSLTRDDVINKRNQFFDYHRKDGWERFDSYPLEGNFPIEELNLSGLNFEDSINLKNERFFGYLKKDDNFKEWRTNFKDTSLINANLRGAILRRCILTHANLKHANMQGADTDLVEAHLEGAYLLGSDMREASFEGVQWGSKYDKFVCGEEIEANNTRVKEKKSKDRKEKASYKQLRRELLKQAESIYRNLKRWHSQAAMHDLAGEFHFREMEVRRKRLSWNLERKNWVRLCFFGVSTGHLERIKNVVVTALLLWILFGVIYVILAWIWKLLPLNPALIIYINTVSFTALGYGPWLHDTDLQGAAQSVAAIESAVGVSMAALFMATLLRKMTR